MTFPARGRPAKSQQRRRRLLDAALRVIGRSGLNGLTHRAVAAEAGLPSPAATYHLGGIDDMLLAVLREANDSYIAQVQTLPDAPEEIPRALAKVMANGLGQDRGRAVAEYQFCMMAADRPGLREELQRWPRALDAVAARCTPDPAARLAISAAIDGLYVRMLTRDPPPDAEELHAALEALIRGVKATEAG